MFKPLVTPRNRKTQKQAAAEGSCSRGLAKHLKGGNSACGDVYEFHTSGSDYTAKDFHPNIKNNPYKYNIIIMLDFPVNFEPLLGHCTKTAVIPKGMI